MRDAHTRAADLRAKLAGLCLQIAIVEDELAATFSEIAKTASAERAGRLLTQASAARDYAVEERVRARQFAD